MPEPRVLRDDTVGTITLGGDLTVRRLGFGAMRISGARDASGKRDRETARALVRRVVERGVIFIDTANIYGYGESEEIIAEALRPYAVDLVIGTKAGYRPGKILAGHATLPPLGAPEHIKAECDLSLARLGVDQLDLYQVHTPDPAVPYPDTIGAFAELQAAGKVRHIGVSNVSLDQLRLARTLCDVVSVQNRFNATDRRSAEVLDYCTAEGIAFIPWAPIINDGRVAAVVGEIATRLGALPQQVGLAWLLQQSPVMLPIPGTSSIDHLDENVDAAWLELSDDDVSRITEAAR